MEKHPDITRARLEAFKGPSLLGGRIYLRRAPVTLEVYSAPGRIAHDEALRGDYRPARVGEHFGPIWSTHWFRVGIVLPDDWKGEEVHLLWNSNSEACIWRDGQPRQGLSGPRRLSSNKPPIRTEYPVVRPARGGEHITLHVEVACNNLLGVETDLEPDPTGYLRQAEIAVFDREAWDLFWDFTIVADMAIHLPPDTPRAGQALYAANKMINVCDLDDRTTWPAARAVAADFLSARSGDAAHEISAVGHGHLDTAWLWPIAETKRKCVRTFTTALQYMEEYPEYKFVCTSAQHYAWMKELHPDLYARIREYVKKGQFIPAGGSWIEPDCNIPSGESLVRQFLTGQRFFRREFGRLCTEFWNPDVFGYSAQLPQILRGAGIRSFLTQKLSWSQFNQLPVHTFFWEGIDGTRVLTHFPPADSYNALANVEEVVFNVRNFRDHERCRESCMLFGYGDGGGGPTRGMLEQLRRMKDVEGLPRVEIREPAAFFERCRLHEAKLTKWVGELYLELHRGTYTTQARVKQYNRECEGALHDVEWLHAITGALDGEPYPRESLEEVWRNVLVNQFHDIIPGSSIHEVYVDAETAYRKVLEETGRLREEAIDRLIAAVHAEPAGFSNPGHAKALAVNTLSTPREEIVECPPGAQTAQVSADGQPLGIVRAPANGYRIAPPADETEEAARIHRRAETWVMENRYIRASFRADGRLSGLYDKRVEREIVAPDDNANRFIIYEDRPLAWDAWDVDIFHLEKPVAAPEAAAVAIIEEGPLRVGLEFRYALTPRSSITQRVYLTAISPRLDFENEADWHEDYKFLKVEFPLNLRSDFATYEIQFGHLRRPTHFNTSWDLARFEVCAQRWAELAEPDYGVALINDCKYGYATHGNVMRLSLLRSPKYPDPEADRGHHRFRYALFPHPGTLQTAGVIDEAARFNRPMAIRATDAPDTELSYFSVSHSNVVIDTIKKAEDDDALVLRLYETHGARCRATLTSALPIRSAALCNLLEEDEQELSLTGGGVSLDVSPFQILTLKCRL